MKQKLFVNEVVKVIKIDPIITALVNRAKYMKEK